MPYKDIKKKQERGKKYRKENKEHLDEYHRNWRDKNRERVQTYALRRFGITLEQYNILLKEQDNKCAICLKPAASLNKRLAVDHDHKTGEIRGLLCNFCNHRLIGKHRDADKFIRAANYLTKERKGWIVPKRKRKRKARGRKSRSVSNRS